MSMTERQSKAEERSRKIDEFLENISPETKKKLKRIQRRRRLK